MSKVPASTFIIPDVVKLSPKIKVPPVPLIDIAGNVLLLEVIVLVPLVAPNFKELAEAVTVIPLDNV